MIPMNVLTGLRRTLCRLGAAMAVITVVGCAAQPPVPQDRYYRLQSVVATAPLAAPALPGILEIERFSADGLADGRPIVYIDPTDPNQLLEYHYHFWTQSPSIMLRDELVTYLRAVKVATNVVSPEMRLEPEFAMTGRSVRLEQILSNPGSTVMELEFAIRKQSDNKLVFLKSYRQDVKQASSGVSGAVDALNQALNLIYADLLADLRKL